LLSLKIQKYNVNRYDKSKNLNKFKGWFACMYNQYIYIYELYV